MGWCHIQSVSPPHVYNFVCISKAPLSASRSFIAKFNHGKKESPKKTRLNKLRASTAKAVEVFDSVARVRDGDEHAGEVLDGFSVRGDSPEEEDEVGGLELFYDDGYGSSSVRDYLDIAKEMVRPDGGHPRWFCPIECGRPIKGAPVLLFLPGIDGVGLGLILHHRSLGKVFEVRCMHIPAFDRTPFEGLVKFVEATVRIECALSPNKPIYLVGDSFGGCLALSVAARNPAIDLILILANPATSIDDSQLQPVLPLLKSLPHELHPTVPYLLSFVMGDPVKLAMADIKRDLNPAEMINKLLKNLTSMLPQLSKQEYMVAMQDYKTQIENYTSCPNLEDKRLLGVLAQVLADAIPKDTFLWKLELLRSAAAYANSRLHAVKAEVLVLASGDDKMLPSKKEAERLWNELQNCKVRYFNDHGHAILLENGIQLFSVIKGALMYRRSSKYDHVSDFLPPSKADYEIEFEKENGIIRLVTSPVILSTLEAGTIVRGLAGVPNEGPVLLVGYHMLFGIELAPLIDAFLKEKNVLVRGMAHPMVFSEFTKSAPQDVSRFDHVRLFGAVPVTAKNMYKLFSSKSFVLLYPGGVREAFHFKGEEYQLFWPEQPEFVRMAARFGATIVPFGVIGEDDVAELLLDYNDQMNIPFLRDWVQDINDKVIKLRTNADGEVANQKTYLPVVLPKLPGRFYYLFGKPYETKGKEYLNNRVHAKEAYLQIKSEVERTMRFLQEKRNEDPYRSILPRIAYQASWGWSRQAPTFKP